MVNLVISIVDKMVGENKKTAEIIIQEFCSNIPDNLDFIQRKSKLIQLLEEIQKIEGHISREVASKVSDALNLPLTHVYGVITFYNSLKLEQNTEYVINLCTGTACHVNGSSDLLKILKKEIEVCENPKIFSIDTVNCVGACSLAPVVMVNGIVHGKMIDKKIKQLINDLLIEHKNNNPQKYGNIV